MCRSIALQAAIGGNGGSYFSPLQILPTTEGGGGVDGFSGKWQFYYDRWALAAPVEKGFGEDGGRCHAFAKLTTILGGERQ